MPQHFPIPEPNHWKYAGEALFFLWLAWRVMRWVFRTSNEIQEPSAAEAGSGTDEEIRARAKAADSQRSGSADDR